MFCSMWCGDCVMNTSESSQASLSLTGVAEGITDSLKPNARYEASPNSSYFYTSKKVPTFRNWQNILENQSQKDCTAFHNKPAESPRLHTQRGNHPPRCQARECDVCQVRCKAKTTLKWHDKTFSNVMFSRWDSKQKLEVSQIKCSATSPRSWSWLTLDLLDDCRRTVGHQLSQLGRYVYNEHWWLHRSKHHCGGLIPTNLVL